MPRKGRVPDYENDKVYLMRRESDGVLKFGTSHDVHVRRSALGKDMVILAVTDGSYEKEREICERFQTYALKPSYGSRYCEWFHPVQEILDFAAAHMEDPIVIAKQMRFPAQKTIPVTIPRPEFVIPKTRLPRPAVAPHVPWAHNQLAPLLEQKRIAEGRHITLAEVSKATGVDYPALHKMLQNPRNGGGNAEHNRALMAYFNCSWTDLFFCEQEWREQKRDESRRIGNIKTLLQWGLVSEANVKYLRRLSTTPFASQASSAAQADSEAA